MPQKRNPVALEHARVLASQKPSDRQAPSSPRYTTHRSATSSIPRTICSRSSRHCLRGRDARDLARRRRNPRPNVDVAPCAHGRGGSGDADRARRHAGRRSRSLVPDRADHGRESRPSEAHGERRAIPTTSRCRRCRRRCSPRCPSSTRTWSTASSATSRSLRRPRASHRRSHGRRPARSDGRLTDHAARRRGLAATRSSPPSSRPRAGSSRGRPRAPSASTEPKALVLGADRAAEQERLAEVRRARRLRHRRAPAVRARRPDGQALRALQVRPGHPRRRQPLRRRAAAGLQAEVRDPVQAAARRRREVLRVARQPRRARAALLQAVQHGRQAVLLVQGAERRTCASSRSRAPIRCRSRSRGSRRS